MEWRPPWAGGPGRSASTTAAATPVAAPSSTASGLSQLPTACTSTPLHWFWDYRLIVRSHQHLFSYPKCQLQATSGVQLGGVRRHHHTRLGQNGRARGVRCGKDHLQQRVQPQEPRRRHRSVEAADTVKFLRSDQRKTGQCGMFYYLHMEAASPIEAVPCSLFPIPCCNHSNQQCKMLYTKTQRHTCSTKLNPWTHYSYNTLCSIEEEIVIIPGNRQSRRTAESLSGTVRVKQAICETIQRKTSTFDALGA